ncbi:hypothetical protein ACFFSW_01065 [Saccharothrix longispora]|uniref:Uncharacterized protein n=1 Tax=Saccharothrix longispora TaxID=33920 RepID=A0ABU1PVB9_9PSEU|nr:hypothetical protein [Saccharothrix longispora]MDR6594570.1 hypothetical protein [Saccharothrix longispora]
MEESKCGTIPPEGDDVMGGLRPTFHRSDRIDAEKVTYITTEALPRSGETSLFDDSDQAGGTFGQRPPQVSRVHRDRAGHPMASSGLRVRPSRIRGTCPIIMAVGRS